MVRKALARHAVLVVLLLAVPLGASDKPVDRVVFGSCAGQDRPQPFWKPIIALKPDLFMMLGDNVYADTLDPAAYRMVFAALTGQAGFRELKRATPVLAVWDDHDYGSNDAGGENPKKAVLQQIFLDAFDVPADSPRRKRAGVYHSEIFGPPGRRLQVIMMDTRYFRSPLKKGKGYGHYVPDPDPKKTILGEEQWAWLKEQLRRPADLRFLVSSIQVATVDQPHEKWANFPRERERLLTLIRESGVGRLVVLSGDRHHAELSRVPKAIGYDLWDFTSSSFNKPYIWQFKDPIEPNAYRVGPLVRDANFGVVDIRWDPPASVTFEIHQSTGGVRLRQTVLLDSLKPAQ